jgi:hypothetical protein
LQQQSTITNLILRSKQTTLFDTPYETRLFGSSRLHYLFVNIEGMTANKYKNLMPLGLWVPL